MIDTLWRPGCRLHGPGCRVAWGYDEAHTDQDYPYTLEQLAARTAHPHYYAYPDHAAYVEGWRLWVALQRDARLTDAEADVVFNVRLDRLNVPEEVRAEFRRATTSG